MTCRGVFESVQPRAATATFAAAILTVALGCPRVLAGTQGAHMGGSLVPVPLLSRLVPHGYRIVDVYRANLGGKVVPDVVVSSVGPPRGPLSTQHADLQVVSWEQKMRRWAVVFDAQKTIDWPVSVLGPEGSNSGAGDPYGVSPSSLRGPILDPNTSAEVSVDRVRFARLLGTSRDQLVFSATNVAAGGMQGILVVVRVLTDTAKVIFAWEGEGGLGPWRIARDIIEASAHYFTPIDSLCCPVRTYAFAVAERGGLVKEISDDRPFLGVVVRGIATDLAVIRVVPATPAAGHLRVGDILLDVENAPPPASGAPPPSNTSIYDQLGRLRARAKARLLVDRKGSRITVTVTLGSLDSAAAESLRTPTTNGSTNGL